MCWICSKLTKNSKRRQLTFLWCLYCQLWVHLTQHAAQWSSVRMFNFERLLDCLNRNYINPADIYLFKINNVNTRSMHGIRSKLIKTAEWKDAIDVVSVSFLLTLNRFHTLFQCFHCWIWTSKCRLQRFYRWIFCTS